MAVETAVVTGTLNGSASGTRDFTKAGFGTPTAALVFATRATSASNPYTTKNGISIGFWDGTNQHCTGLNTRDNNSSPTGNFSFRRYSTSNIIFIPDDQSSPSNDVSATIASTTDGVTITTTAHVSEDSYIVVVLFKGTTNEYVGTATLSSTTVDNTAPGFKPDLVFVLSNNNGNANHTSSGRINFGVAHNSSTDVVTQGGIMTHSQGGATAGTQRCRTRISDSYVASEETNTSTNWTLDLGSFDSSGFTFNSSTSNSDVVLYMAIELDDPDDAAVVFDDAKTSTGTEASTSAGFEPQILGMMASGQTAYDSPSQIGSIAFGVGDTTTEASIAYVTEDQADPTVAETRFATKLVQIVDEDTTVDSEASIDSLDASGWTLDWTDAATSADKIVYWAIKTSAVPTLSSPTATSITDTTATVGCTVTF